MRGDGDAADGNEADLGADEDADETREVGQHQVRGSSAGRIAAS